MKQKIPVVIAGLVAAAICAVGLYLGSMLPIGKWVASLLETIGAINKATPNAIAMTSIVLVLMPIIFVSVGAHIKLMEMMNENSNQNPELPEQTVETPHQA